MQTPLFTHLSRCILVSGFLLGACNPSATDSVRAPALKDTLAIANVSQVMPKSVNETLPVLQIEVAEAKKINSKVAFRFFIDTGDVISIRGWTPPYNNKAEDVELVACTPSGTRIGPGNYLGNLYLKKADLDNIIAAAEAKGDKYLRFVPVVDTRPGSVGQITYRIISAAIALRSWNSIPTDSIMMMMADTTGLGSPALASDLLNPSPPRNE